VTNGEHSPDSFLLTKAVYRSGHRNAEESCPSLRLIVVQNLKDRYVAIE
jgi:hypothetical protein